MNMIHADSSSCVNGGCLARPRSVGWCSLLISDLVVLNTCYAMTVFHVATLPLEVLVPLEDCSAC